MQLVVWDQANRPNRTVCPYSPLVVGGRVSLLEALEATGLAAHCLTICHRSDAKIRELAALLRGGNFGAYEHKLCSEAGTDLRHTSAPAKKTDRFQNVTDFEQILTLMPEATVLCYTNDEVESFTQRFQSGKKLAEVDCVDEMDGSVEVFKPDPPQPKFWESSLEGALTKLVLCDNCPVRLGRGRMGKKVSATVVSESSASVPLLPQRRFLYFIHTQAISAD